MNRVTTTARWTLPSQPAGTGAWHAALVAVAAGAVLLGAPAALTVVLSGSACVAVAERAVRRRGLGWLDAVLVATGGTLATLIVVGLGLHLLGAGLSAWTWAVALSAVAFGVLRYATAPDGSEGAERQPAAARQEAAAAVQPARRQARRAHLSASARAVLPVLPWITASVLVVVLAVGMSVRATRASDVPPLALALEAVQPTTATVVVSAGGPTGPLELRSDLGDGVTARYPLSDIRPGEPVTTTVAVRAKGETLVTLSSPGYARALRTLKVAR